MIQRLIAFIFLLWDQNNIKVSDKDERNASKALWESQSKMELKPSTEEIPITAIRCFSNIDVWILSLYVSRACDSFARESFLNSPQVYTFSNKSSISKSKVVMTTIMIQLLDIIRQTIICLELIYSVIWLIKAWVTTRSPLSKKV